MHREARKGFRPDALEELRPAPADVQDPFTLLYSHGNAEDLGHARPRLEELRDMDFAVLAYDYRGYGASESVRTTERGVYRDIDAAYDYLIGVVLDSPFTSAFRVVTRVPLFPFDRFQNLRRIRRLDVPVLVIHGTRDEIIPIAHGRALHAAAPGLRGAGAVSYQGSVSRCSAASASHSFIDSLFAAAAFTTFR